MFFRLFNSFNFLYHPLSLHPSYPPLLTPFLSPLSLLTPFLYHLLPCTYFMLESVLTLFFCVTNAQYFNNHNCPLPLYLHYTGSINIFKPSIQSNPAYPPLPLTPFYPSPLPNHTINTFPPPLPSISISIIAFLVLS